MARKSNTIRTAAILTPVALTVWAILIAACWAIGATAAATIDIISRSL